MGYHQVGGESSGLTTVEEQWPRYYRGTMFGSEEIAFLWDFSKKRIAVEEKEILLFATADEQ